MLHAPGLFDNPKQIPLKELLLDPNDFRLSLLRRHNNVSPSMIAKPEIQEQTREFLLGKDLRNVQDLVSSFKKHGWKSKRSLLAYRDKAVQGGYVLVDGNRRIATIKHYRKRGIRDPFPPHLFLDHDVVVCAREQSGVYLATLASMEILDGDSGPAFEWSMRLTQVTNMLGGALGEAARLVGLSRRDVSLWVRSFHFVRSYMRSDYGDQFHPDSFPIFLQLLKNPVIQEWIEWHDLRNEATNKRHLTRLFSWLSREAFDFTTGDPAALAPVITKPEDVQRLAQVLDDPAAVRRLEETRSLDAALGSSEQVVKHQIAGAIALSSRGIEELDAVSSKLEDSDLDAVQGLIDKLGEISVQRGRRPVLLGPGKPWDVHREQMRFTSLEFERYRGIDGLVLEDLAKVNLLVGINNAGKTSVLEAIYLLARQNDERGLLETIRNRQRTESGLPAKLLVMQLPEAGLLHGTLDGGGTTTVSITRDTTVRDDLDNQTAFLENVDIEAAFDNETCSTSMTLFENRQQRTTFQGTSHKWLCRAAFTSPFWSGRPAQTAQLYEQAVKEKIKKTVVDFIREHVDTGVLEIDLVNKFDQFLVNHANFDEAVDLSTFGDGERRVFEIALMFAAARGGVVLIDEFETALHTTLRNEFAGFVQELAEQLDVQVFITTHSKETVDAFVLNDEHVEGVVGFALRRRDDGVAVKRYDGKKLRRLHESVDFDIRGIR